MTDFINGTEDRFGNPTSPEYSDAVQNLPPESLNAAMFDENCFDPYERRYALINNPGPVVPPYVGPPVLIRFTATGDLSEYDLVAVGGVPNIRDNGDGTWDLYSDDPVEFIALNGAYYQYNYAYGITKIEVIKGDTLKYFYLESELAATFAMMDELTEFIWSDRDVCIPTSTDYMFAGTNKINISKLDTHLVQTMEYMFRGAGIIGESLDLSSLDTSNVSDMTGMFSEMVYGSVDLTNFDTSNVRSMDFMFRNCPHLGYLDLSSFTFVQVTVAYMIYDNESLTCTTNIDSTNAMDKDHLFGECDNLINPTSQEKVDIRSAQGLNYVNQNDCPEQP